MLETIFNFLGTQAPQWSFLGRILLAVFLGGLLGWQRESWGKAAGSRTYALVTAGSALFTILSTEVFGGNFSNSINVAAQIVVGIGFLGAGMILHRKNHIDGLTTAAGLWVAAAIGMAAGAKMYLLSVGMTVMMFAVLMVDDKALLVKKQKTEKE